MKPCCLFALAVLATTAFAGTVAPALAQGSCQELWVERNTIFKDAGYCFKTSRAIRYFGNAGCQYDEEADVPLSPRERARVNRLRQLEREYGCR